MTDKDFDSILREGSHNKNRISKPIPDTGKFPIDEKSNESVAAGNQKPAVKSGRGSPGARREYQSYVGQNRPRTIEEGDTYEARYSKTGSLTESQFDKILNSKNPHPYKILKEAFDAVENKRPLRESIWGGDPKARIKESALFESFMNDMRSAAGVPTGDDSSGLDGYAEFDDGDLKGYAELDEDYDSDISNPDMNERSAGGSAARQDFWDEKNAEEEAEWQMENGDDEFEDFEDEELDEEDIDEDVESEEYWSDARDLNEDPYDEKDYEKTDEEFHEDDYPTMDDDPLDKRSQYRGQDYDEATLDWEEGMNNLELDEDEFDDDGPTPYNGSGSLDDDDSYWDNPDVNEDGDGIGPDGMNPVTGTFDDSVDFDNDSDRFDAIETY